MKHILVTGYGPFGGLDVNPSAKLVAALDGLTFGDALVVGRSLPVSTRDLRERLYAHADEVKPAAIICIGLFPGEPVIRLERLAINFTEFGIPDNDGAIHRDVVAAGGPDAFKATWPVREIHRRLLEAGVPARISEHAGTFLCNATLYHALSHFDGRPDAPKIGFIHVPYLPEQVSGIILSTLAEQRLELYQRQDLASMAFEVQLQAAKIAIETTLADL